MKGTIRIFSACLTGVMLLAGCLWLLNTVQTARGSSPLPSPSLGAKKPEYILVDDFKDGNFPENELGGANACYDDKGGLVSCDLTATVQDSYVEMTYNVTTGSSYAWLQMDLGTPGNYADLSALDAVWIVVKGEEGGERIYAEFKDCGPPETSHYPKVEIGDYLAEGITTNWGAAVIPLSAFNGLSDWSCIDRFSIVAHNDISSGLGKIYVGDARILPSTVLIDDFRDQEWGNELGGSSGPWNQETVVITPTYPNGVLKLSYNVPPGPVGGGYWTELTPTNLVSQKDYLFFDIRGEQGGEEILVQIKDCGTNGYTHYPEIKISDYLECGGITTTWRTVSVPLAAFVEAQSDTDQGVDWTCIDQLAFNVDGRYDSGQGTVYFDEVKLVPASALPCRHPLLVDHFHDCDNQNALNWEWRSGVTGTAEFTAAPDPVNRRGDCGCGYRLAHTVTVSGSTWTYTELRGLDVTDYFYLEFYIKGREGGEATHVYLRDRAGNERSKLIEATKNWRRVMIPLSYFTSTVLTDLSEVKFAYEWAFLNSEVYIDDISFIKPCIYLPVLLRYYCSDELPSCPSLYNNYEPNNFRCSTTFALSSGVPIQSYICAEDDIDDYYYIDVSSLSPITISLTSIPDEDEVDYDLCLYYGDAFVVCSDNYGNANEVINHTPTQTGRYYIRVYPYSGYSLSSYTLQADFQ